MRKLKLLLAACALVAGSMTVSAAIVSGTTYYLQNKASGRFISSGHGWFTRSTLSPVLDYPIQLNSSGDGYILKIVGSNQLGHNLYVDNSNNNVWTITAVEGEENVYTIANGTNYLGSDGSFILSGSLTDATSDAAKWYIRSKDDYLSMFTSASAENPVDASFYITGPSYDYTDTNRDNKWTMDGFGAGTELTRGSGTTAINPYVVERYSGTGSIKQKLTGLKKGMYGVSVYGFYRAGNNNAASASRTENTEAQNAIIFAGTKEKPLKSIYDDAQASAVAGSFNTNTSFGFVPNLRSTAGECFANGYYKNTIYVYIDSDGAELEIGVKKDATIAEDWAIIDNWCMTYYGSEELTETEIILAASVKTYKEALAAAQAYQSADMFDTDKTALNTAINNNIIDLSGNVTEEQLITAANNLNAAAANAAKDVARYNTYTTAVSTINSGENVDLTSLIVNPSFENNFTGWTNTGSMAIQGNTSFGKTGNNYVEFWQPNGTKGVSQTIDALPSGLYSLTVKVKARGVTSAKVFAAGINQEVTIADAENEYTVNFALDDKSSTLIGFEGIGTGAGNSWLALDNFRLTYIGELPNELTAVTGKMNSTVDADQTSAINAYNSNQTVANYNAAQSAIAAAQASVAAYTLAATAIADANAVKTNQNFATAAAITAFENAIQAIQDKYDNGTLTNDEANNAGLTLGVGMSGVRTNPTGAAIQYMNSGFGLTNFDAALYVNTWSTEGANDGSNFTFPFYEYWVSEANSLGANTWTGTLTGLENGLYKVSALVRVRAKNDVAAADASGITMNVTSGDAVDVTKGTQIGEGQFLLKEFTAEGLVKDGNLVLNFNIAADNNISWLSFKNVNYTKVRDLTPEEMATAPTAIALYNGETEVTEPIALDPTTNTVTLTPSYTPAEASEGYIEWTTSDANVATVTNEGVVKAVSSGTAIITVTSTLDESVKTTATVYVSYPESEVAEYTNNGATRYIHDYGANLIKNGTFEYPNPFQGWKSGANGNCDANNYEIVTNGDNKYIKAKESKGAGDSHSISTGWPIEAGKTYAFGYKVKADQAGNSEYHVVSLTNTIGTETLKVSVTETPVTTSWTEVNYTFTNPAENGFAFVQFRARWLANNTSFDDFYLCEVNSDDIIQGNVDYATAAIPTANIGTGAFQYSQDAINAANALVQGTATVEDVENAYSALKTVKEPADGQLFNVILTFSGYQYDQKAMTYIANGRTDHGNYNIQYKEAANQNLAQAFTFTKVEGSKYKMSQIDADGNVRYISTGVPYSGTTSQIRTTTDADKALLVEVIPTNTEGVWNLKNTEANNYIGSQDVGVFTVNSHIDFNIVETTKPSIEINTTVAGYGTVMLPFAVATLPTGVKAYTCAELDGPTLNLVEVSTLEANKPYIIEGAWNETLTGDAQGINLNCTEGLLTGVYAETAAPVGSYVLQNQNDVVGFYKVAEGKQPMVGANRAYLNVASSARALYFDGATAIKAIEALTSGEAEIYNAAGARQNGLQKGVNIIKQGGKSIKVMVK